MFRMCSAQTLTAALPRWRLRYGFALLLVIAQQEEELKMENALVYKDCDSPGLHSPRLQPGVRDCNIACFHFSSNQKTVRTVFAEGLFVLLDYPELRDAV